MIRKKINIIRSSEVVSENSTRLYLDNSDEKGSAKSVVLPHRDETTLPYSEIDIAKKSILTFEVANNVAWMNPDNAAYTEVINNYNSYGEKIFFDADGKEMIIMPDADGNLYFRPQPFAGAVPSSDKTFYYTENTSSTTPESELKVSNPGFEEEPSTASVQSSYSAVNYDLNEKIEQAAAPNESPNVLSIGTSTTLSAVPVETVKFTTVSQVLQPETISKLDINPDEITTITVTEQKVPEELNITQGPEDNKLNFTAGMWNTVDQGEGSNITNIGNSNPEIPIIYNTIEQGHSGGNNLNIENQIGSGNIISGGTGINDKVTFPGKPEDYKITQQPDGTVILEEKNDLYTYQIHAGNNTHVSSISQEARDAATHLLNYEQVGFANSSQTYSMQDIAKIFLGNNISGENVIGSAPERANVEVGAKPLQNNTGVSTGKG